MIQPLLTSSWNGTLVVLDRPSRFDTTNGKILSGQARYLVAEALGMRPGEFAVCYQDQQNIHPFPRATIKLMCGPRCVQFGHLDKVRGWVDVNEAGHRLIHTYNPSDALDHGPVEFDDVDEYDESDAFGSTEKDGGVTRWSNFRQWFLLDCKKLMSKLPPPVKFTRLYLPQDDLIAWLRRPRKFLYVDIECDPKDSTLWCIGLADDTNDDVVVIPIYRWDRNGIYWLPKVMAAFCRAAHASIQVLHNGAFDLSLLFIDYGLPISTRIEDTMCMHHRCFPELEKSLGHVVSLWTNDRWHKDSGGSWCPKDKKAYDQLLAYNARDVVTMKACHEAMHREGPVSSMDKVNRNAGMYLLVGLTGQAVDKIKLMGHKVRLTNRIEQFRRLLRFLVGYELNTGSHPQMVNYLYKQMGYAIGNRTEAGEPATDAKTLYNLLSKYDNVALTVILKLQKEKKSLAMLGFEMIAREYNKYETISQSAPT